MANFYQDNDDIRFHMEHLDFSKIVALKEDDFNNEDNHPEAPADLEDAVDNYKQVLSVVGDIAGEHVFPSAEDVDKVGAQFKDGEVTYARGTQNAINRLKQADLLGFTLPRKYDGINMPKIVYSIATEIISRADASLMNIFGLQEIADTILKYGSEEQKEKYLARFSKGDVTGSMALTEPDAGSDLQAVRLKATESEDGKWHLNGVKRFITNGCADISLVMARSEEGTTGGKGISLFIYERDDHMKIRRIEEKLGIHGSPTCELQFNNAPASLLGKRKFGLIKYTMSLMNGARLAVSAQALGIAEAAYLESRKYAEERIQSKQKIVEFSPVYEMLTQMKVSIEAMRTLLYETSRMVDLKEGSEEKLEATAEPTKELRADVKAYTRLAGFFTPLTKAFVTETANKVCYDGIQVHGGVGFTTDFNVERHYRDVRITNIYEGTTQLQVVAAISGVTTGIVFNYLNDFENDHDLSAVDELFERARSLRSRLQQAMDHIKEKNDKVYQNYHSRRLVEMAADTVISYLLCRDATHADRKKAVTDIFLNLAESRVEQAYKQILSNDQSIIEKHNEVI